MKKQYQSPQTTVTAFSQCTHLLNSSPGATLSTQSADSEAEVLSRERSAPSPSWSDGLW